jgi:tRNA(Ile)-lysidine synthase
LEFWSDPHNADDSFARVRVRNSALPAIEAAIGPGVAQALAKTASLVQADLDYLEGQAQLEIKRIVKVGATAVTIAVQELEGLHPAIGGRVIHHALGIFGGSPSKIHVDEVLQLVLNWHGQKELTLPGVRVVRQGDDLTLKSSKTLRPGAC